MARAKVNLDPETLSIRPLSSEQKAGVRLAYFLLVIMCCILGYHFIISTIKELDGSDKILQTLNPINTSDSLFSRKIELVRQIREEKKEYREYVLKNYQYTLGILLPILTSILGYIFGTKAKD